MYQSILVLYCLITFCPGCAKKTMHDHPLRHEDKLIICNDYSMKPTMQLRKMLLDEAIVPEQEWLLVEHRGLQKGMSIYTLVAGRGLPLEMHASLDGSERWRYTYPDSSLQIWIQDQRVVHWR